MKNISPFLVKRQMPILFPWIVKGLFDSPFWFSSLLPAKHRALSIQPKTRNFLNRKIRKLLNFRNQEPFSRKSRKFWEENRMELKFPVRNFQKFGFTSRGRPFYQKFWKMLFHSPLKISGNSIKPKFIVEWKAPIHFLFTLSWQKEVFITLLTFNLS